ncbi:MAG: 2-hydroxyacid dehydrogenase [Labilithrix sp.]|nr:2-hydroxyacid dehydrogenase [Labilithrix sp.]
MRVAFFDVHGYERRHFDAANAVFGHDIVYFDARLTADTAALAAGFSAICAFVDDRLDAPALERLREGGTRLVALRSAGFNNVDLAAAERLGVIVARVPEYSPHAVAEHTVALVLALDRKIHRAHARVREGNFSLEGLVGFDLHTRTVGLVGTGRIGRVAARIFLGFGCTVLAHDLAPDRELAARGVRYVSHDELYASCDVLSLHVPLTPATHHMIDGAALAKTRRGFMLVNTSRGALVDTRALIDGLKSGRIGSACLDVYEEEEGVFFRDLSDRVIQDDLLARLLTFPNVLITAHQAFLTEEALQSIARVTLENVTRFEREGLPLHVVTSGA